MINRTAHDCRGVALQTSGEAHFQLIVAADEIDRLDKRLALVEGDLSNATACWHEACHDISILKEERDALAVDAKRWRKLRELSHHEVLKIIQSDWSEWPALIDDHLVQP